METVFFRRLLAVILAGALSFGVLAGCSDTKTSAAENDDFFAKDAIRSVEITIDEAEWQDLLANPAAEEYHPAALTWNGFHVENAGIRTKGNMTLKAVSQSNSDRFSFKVKFNKYVDGQEFLGLDEMVLNNMYTDPSYLREYLHYEALEYLGMPTPRRFFVNLTVNGELLGLYLGVEALDDSFLENTFGANYKDGNFYKTDMGSTLQYEANEAYAYLELKEGDDEDRAGLKSMIKILGDMPAGEKGDIESVLDVSSALKYIASNTVLGNYDSYNGNMHHNFYLYENADGVFTIVPWDFNMSFGGFGMGSLSAISLDTPICGESVDELPMIKNLLAVDAYKEEYYGYVRELLNWLNGFENRVSELAALIRPSVEADPTRFYTMAQFEASISANNSYSQSVSQGNGRPQGGPRPGSNPGFGGGDMSNVSTSIVSYIRERVANLNQQLSGELPTTGIMGQGVGPDIGRR